MPEAMVQKIALSVAAGPGTANYDFPFDVIDFSWARALRFRLDIATIGVDAGDTFNLYIQSRLMDGIWDDRVAFPQYIGTATDLESYQMALESLVDLSATEQAHEPWGSAGGAHLTVNTVRDGPWAGKYYENGHPEYAWRAYLEAVDAGVNAFFTGTLYVYATEAWG